MSKFWSTMTRRAKPYIPGKQSDNEHILKLNTNENPYPPSPTVIEAIKAELSGSLNLYPSPTVDVLRQDIGNKSGLTKDHVFIGNGSDEVLAFSFMAFFEPHKKILFPAITYSFYSVYATLFNIPYEEISLNRDFTLPVKPFFQSEGGVIFPNPNAPTSLYLPLKFIVEILQQNPEIVVIVDEAYIDFASESAVSLVKAYDNLLVVQTTSKSRSLAGLRVGYAIGHPDLIQALIRIKDSMNSYTIDRLAIVGAQAAIHDVTYTEEIVRRIKKTRAWVTQSLKAYGFYVLPSQTNFVLAEHYEYDGLYLYEKLQEMDVLVRHFDIAPIQNFIRITIGTDKQMELLFEKLRIILNKKPNHWNEGRLNVTGLNE